MSNFFQKLEKGAKMSVDLRDKIKNLKIESSFRLFFHERNLAIHVERSSNVRYKIFVIDEDGCYAYMFTSKESTLDKLVQMTGDVFVQVA